VNIVYGTPVKPIAADTSQFIVQAGTQTLTSPSLSTSTKENPMKAVNAGDLALRAGEQTTLAVTLKEGSQQIHFFEVDLKPIAKE
jgi:hypothetical protein